MKTKIYTSKQYPSFVHNGQQCRVVEEFPPVAAEGGGRHVGCLVEFVDDPDKYLVKMSDLTEVDSTP